MASVMNTQINQGGTFGVFKRRYTKHTNIVYVYIYVVP